MLSPASICSRCDFACAKPRRGPCACTVDGIDILVHIEKRDCPKGFHTNAAMPIMPPPMPIPEGFDVEQERRRMKQGGCCGKPSA